MARYKHIDTQPRLLAVDLSRQLLPGTFEHALNHLLDHALDLCQTWRGPLLADHTGDRWVDGQPIGRQETLL